FHVTGVQTCALPIYLVQGCDFVVTGTLHKETGSEGSVQMQVLTTKPAATPTLVAGSSKEQGGRSTWTDGEGPVIGESPIIVSDRSEERRVGKESRCQ